MSKGREPVIRLATEDDIRAFYGKVDWTFRAYVAELDGEVLGVGGIYYEDPYVVAFSSFKPEMRKFKKTMVRSVRKIMELVKDRSCIAVASDKHDTSEKLLTKLGFERIDGRVFGWTPKS